MSRLVSEYLFIVWPAVIFAAVLCLGQGLRKPRDFWREFE